MKKLFIPPVFVLLCFALIILFYFILPQYTVISFPFNLIGVFISILGFVIMGKARELFKKHATTLEIKTSSSLITEGVFSKTRNPMYVGFSLLLIGISICFMNLFSMLCPFLFIGIMNFIFIPKEEKLMFQQFGKQYLDYKTKVNRWL